MNIESIIQTISCLKLMQSGLQSLRREVSHERNFRLLAEGFVNEVSNLREQLDTLTELKQGEEVVLSEAAKKMESFLVLLHTEIREGRGDENRADEIRDEMDHPWRELTTEERALHNHMSGDLYFIGKDEIPYQLEEGMTPEENRNYIFSELTHKRWITALEGLRRPSIISRCENLFLRYLCYKGLGYLVAAKAFNDAFEKESIPLV